MKDQVILSFFSLLVKKSLHDTKIGKKDCKCKVKDIFLDLLLLKNEQMGTEAGRH